MKEGYKFFNISHQQEKKYFLYILCLIAFTIPFKAIFNSIICITLLLFWVLFMTKKFEARKLKIGAAISVLFWIALLGMVHTQNIDEGLFRLQQKSLLIIFPLVFGTISIDWQDNVKWILTVFVCAIMIACIACLIGASVFWLSHQSTERFFSEPLAESGFINLYPYILAFLCLSGVFILAESLLGTLPIHSLLKKPLVSLPFILFLSLFIHLLSVKQIILILIMLIIGYSLRLRRTYGIILLVMGCTVLLVSSLSIPTLRTRVKESFEEYGKKNPLTENPASATPLNGISLRRALWVCAVDVIRDNPLVGVGTGDSQDVLQESYEKREFILASRYNTFNTHNQYLQTFVSFGILGFAIWLVSLFWLFVNLKDNWPFICLLVMLMFAMFTESMLETNKGVLIMAFLLSVFSYGIVPKKVSSS